MRSLSSIPFWVSLWCSSEALKLYQPLRAAHTIKAPGFAGGYLLRILQCNVEVFLAPVEHRSRPFCWPRHFEAIAGGFIEVVQRDTTQLGHVGVGGSHVLLKPLLKIGSGWNNIPAVIKVGGLIPLRL